MTELSKQISMNAQEAKKIALQVPENINLQIMRDITASIEYAAKGGEFAVLFAIPTQFYNEIVLWLTEQGYTVDYTGPKPPSTEERSQLCWIGWK